MKSIVEQIEDSICDIVFFAARSAEYYDRYLNEFEKPRDEQDREAIQRFFSIAKNSALRSVEAAHHAGLDPKKVTRTCWDFLDIFDVRDSKRKRKGAA